MFKQMEYPTKEILAETEGIFDDLGMDNDLATHTIILYGELQCVECGGMKSCGWGGESFEVFSAADYLDFTQAEGIGILGGSCVFAETKQGEIRMEEKCTTKPLVGILPLVCGG